MHGRILRVMVTIAFVLMVGVTHAARNAAASNCDGFCPGSSDGLLSKWSATADAVFLTRSDPGSSVLAFNTADPGQVLNASDLNFGNQTGADLSIRRRLSSQDSLELRYFGFDQWNATSTTPTTANDLLQFDSAIPVFAISGDAIESDYSSKLNNGEINVVRQADENLGFLVGFRYLELDERGTASLSNAAIPFDYVATTRNRLYGAQLGIKTCLWSSDLFSIGAIGKAGLYGNATAHDALIRSNIASLPANGSESVASFVGELGLNGTARLTNRLSLQGGYRLLWLEGVSVASDQLGASDFFNGTGISTSGDVFYQGAFAGLQLGF